MKNKTKNNQSFYNYDVVKLLENLIKSSKKPSQKFSYWLLNQAIKGQHTLFIDCLIETHKINNPDLFDDREQNDTFLQRKTHKTSKLKDFER